MIRITRMRIACYLINMTSILFFIYIYQQLYAETGPYTTTWIPSESAEEQGVEVRIKKPISERYTGEGAPIVVYLSGGFKNIGIGDKDGGLAQYGFIEIQFDFPGDNQP